MKFGRSFLPVAIALGALLAGAGDGLAQKYGGILQALSRGNPSNLSLHQTNTITTVFPMSPVYNNLVFHDPFKAKEGPATIIPELATGWEWSKGHTHLTFKLHRGVKWHDGKPFTSKDVKQTWDDARGVSGRPMKLNPHKMWWNNVKEIRTNGDYEVTFVLGRPQPALLELLAVAMSAVHPAHMQPNALRTKAMGTGPFKLHAFLRDQKIELRKNPDYFIKKRPYLDGIDYLTIKSQSTRFAALVAGQADISFPGETVKPIYMGLKESMPNLVYSRTNASSIDNVIFNPSKPPFNDKRMRLVVALAMDRDSFIKGVRQGGGFPSAALLPPPHGVWGLPEQQLRDLPGYGNAKANKEKARKLMRELGFGPDRHFKVKLSTRALSSYVGVANWIIAELKDVWIDAEMEQIQSGNWYGKLAKMDYAFGTNQTNGTDDPDSNFFENYACGSPRNYTKFCDKKIDAMMLRMSSQIDFKDRLKLAREIDAELQRQSARPMLGFRFEWRTWWPYVKNVVPHQSHFNYHRMQDVWLDK